MPDGPDPDRPLIPGTGANPPTRDSDGAPAAPGPAGDGGTPGRIRPARPGEFPRLLALQGGLDRPAPGLLRAALDGAGRVLASTAGTGPDASRPVGYLLAVPGREAVHVAELVVAPDHRREGRATALLAALAARTDAPALRLAVAPDNRAARRCYRAAGFEPVRRDGDFFDGDPAVILERSRR